MDQQSVNLFMSTMKDKFPSCRVITINSFLLKSDENTFRLVCSLNYKNPTTLLIISLFFGFLGIDRFAISNIFVGIIKLVTLGCLGILVIIDWCLIMEKTRLYNYKLIIDKLPKDISRELISMEN